MRWDELFKYPLKDRVELPQVELEHLARAGIPHEMDWVRLGLVRPSQTDDSLDPEKIQGCLDGIRNGDFKPLLVDRDNNIVNGHHRFAAAIKARRAYVQVHRARATLDQIVAATKNIAPIMEGSPDTVAGSFTPDLIDSKQWLCRALAGQLMGESAGVVYALGSWYGNIGIILQEAGVRFDRLVLVELDPQKLDQSARLLPRLVDQKRLELVNKPAEQVKFEPGCTIINTSSNEMPIDWLSNAPQGSLVAIQGRSNTMTPVPTPTPYLLDFDHTFPLSQVAVLEQRSYSDPQTDYRRFLKIGYR